MSAPGCYVIQSGEFSAGMNQLGLALLLCVFVVWLAGWDWHALEWRIRRFLRRRRLSRIRAARMGEFS